MNKINVLVFPCGSEIGLELHRSLSFSTHFELYGGSSVDDHGKVVYDNYVPDIPNIVDDKFIETINTVIDLYDIEYIFPAHDGAIVALSDAEERGEIHCRVVTSEAETCRIARSKRLTYEELADVVPVPDLYSADTPPDSYPVFIKPTIGQGSKGAYVVNSKSEMKWSLLESRDFVVTEYLPGDEYTVDCFTNVDGELLYSQARVRSRTSNGISVNSMTTNDEDLGSLAAKINSKLNFRGAWFFQVKRNSEGNPVLMEIATRIAGTSSVSRALGVNLPLLSLFDMMGMRVSVIKNEYMVTTDRALYNCFSLDLIYDHVYIDFDDLIINSDESVNTKAIEFLYKCKNEGKRVYIISRHEKDIFKTMEKFGIAKSLFEQISVINYDEKKSDYIHERNSIFIDDSFAERMEVYNKTKIPTFDAHMFEVLVNSY